MNDFDPAPGGEVSFGAFWTVLSVEAECRYLLGEPTFPSMRGTGKDAPEVDIVAKPVAGQITRCITASARR